MLDAVRLGEAASRSSHSVSEVADANLLVGLLGDPTCRLLPNNPASWEGGKLGFTLKVDPERQNYLTVRLSGDDVSDDRLFLFIDGKQVGYRHLGDVDQLDFGTTEPAYPGRFSYVTTPVPMAATRGKSQLRFEIRSTGPVWGYGQSFEQYQKPMAEPTRGIYAAYSHVNGYFAPPAEEKQGSVPADPPVRKSPGPEVLDQVKARVNGEIGKLLDAPKPCSQMQMALLAKAYDVTWTPACDNPKTVGRILDALDSLFAGYRRNPNLAHAEPSTWNPDWFGLGVSGQVIALRQKELEPYLDKQIDDGQGGRVTRRAAFSEMLVECRDWHRKNRRLYTNQTMLNDLNGIYLANRGIEVLSPGQALSEPEARRYLYESVGLIPWTDSDPGGNRWNVGPNYLELTAKGLTKELGYVGTYGEVIDLVADIYNATRPMPGEPGDDRIKAQLIKIAIARSQMRYPALDAEGNRAMRLEQIVGWRDSHHPGVMVYAQRATRDASALQAAAITLDPRLVGYAQQMIADNQFFASEVEAMADKAQPLRTTIGRLATPGEYETVCAQPATGRRLPLSWDQPDSVFSDEEDGVVAVKNGRELLFASLYWRARYGINNLARVHYLTPEVERVAVVAEETRFSPSDMTYTRPDWTNFDFGNGGIRYPGEHHSAHAGETQPIAQVPGDVPFKPGQESPYAGRGDFYTLEYGPYLIGLNMSASKAFDLAPRRSQVGGMELVSRKPITSETPWHVAPRTTVVFSTAGASR